MNPVEPKPFFKGPLKDIVKQELERLDKENQEKEIPVNIYMNEKAYLINLFLPGCLKENIIVNYEKNKLSVEIQQEIKNNSKIKSFFVQEFNPNYKKRTFTIPIENIDINNIYTNYKDGILIISLPKIDLNKKLSNHKWIL